MRCNVNNNPETVPASGFACFQMACNENTGIFRCQIDALSLSFDHGQWFVFHYETLSLPPTLPPTDAVGVRTRVGKM